MALATGGNYISFGTELFSYLNDVINNNYSFTNNLTYVAGKHTITGGVAFDLQKFGNSYLLVWVQDITDTNLLKIS